jgi:hypothetical protein
VTTVQIIGAVYGVLFLGFFVVACAICRMAALGEGPHEAMERAMRRDEQP